MYSTCDESSTMVTPRDIQHWLRKPTNLHQTSAQWLPWAEYWRYCMGWTRQRRLQRPDSTRSDPGKPSRTMMTMMMMMMIPVILLTKPRTTLIQVTLCARPCSHETVEELRIFVNFYSIHFTTQFFVKFRHFNSLVKCMVYVLLIKLRLNTSCIANMCVKRDRQKKDRHMFASVRLLAEL